jgi:hypothetical protein
MPGKKQMIKACVRYKDALVAYYTNLLDISKCRGATILIEELINIETRHKEELIGNQVISTTQDINLSGPVMLTPTHELGCLSKAVQSIIQRKQDHLDLFLRIVGGHKTAPLIGAIKAADLNIQKKLKNISSRI